MPAARALVTGGAGFIGARLTARLVERGFEVVVVDDLSAGDRRRVEALKGVRLLQADVRSLPRYAGELGVFTHVFHLAALISASQSLVEPDAYFDTNVGGLLRVLELCSQAPPPRLVFASTSAVYGDSSRALKSEDDLPQLASVYAATKLAGEQLLSMYRSRLGFDDVSLRFFNVYGPGASSEHPYASVVSRFVQAAVHGGIAQLQGDGGATRDFVYVDDVVDATLAVALSPTRHRVYNVGTGRSSSIAELLATVQRLALEPITVELQPARPGDVRASCADAARLEAELGFRAKVGLEQGLRQTIDYVARVG